MPSRDKIEEYNQSLIQLGDEPAVAAARGETIEEVSAPDGPDLGDISNLISGDSDGASVADQQSNAIDSFLSSIDESVFEQDDGALEGAGAEIVDEPETDEFGIDDDFASALSSQLSGDDFAGEDFASLMESPGEAEAPETSDEFEGLEEFGGADDFGGGDDFAGDDFASLMESSGEAESPETIDDFEDLEEFEDLDEFGGGEEAVAGDNVDEPESIETPESLIGGDADLNDLLSGLSDSSGDEFDFSNEVEPNPLDDLEELADTAAVPSTEKGNLFDVEADEEFSFSDEDGIDALDSDESDLGDFTVPGFEEETNQSLDAGFGDIKELDDMSMGTPGLAADSGEQEGGEGDDVFDFDGMFSDDTPLSSDDESGFSFEEDQADDFAMPGMGDDDFGSASQDDGDDGIPTDLDSIDDGFGSGDDGFSLDGDLPDEFSMGDFGAEFGMLEEVAGQTIETPESSDFEAEAGDDSIEHLSEESPEDIEVSDQLVQDARKALRDLPLNLRIAVQEVLSSAQQSWEKQKNLLEALAGGESARSIAGSVSRITGKKIKVPRGYEKQSGQRFEQDRDSIGYYVRTVIFPIASYAVLSLGLLVGLILGIGRIADYLGTQDLYAQGRALIADAQYIEGNAKFNEAWERWPDPNKIIDYARDFDTMNQLTLADGKYTMYMDVVEEDREIRLEYAGFSAQRLRDFDQAIALLDPIFAEDNRDPDALLLKADLSMEWERYVQDPRQQEQLLEQARSHYALLMEEQGQSDRLLFRMLRYFIRSDNYPEVEKIRELYQEIDTEAAIEPGPYGDMGGYLLTKATGPGARASDAYQVLLRAVRENDQLPHIHFYLSKYFKMTGDRPSERISLTNAVELYDELSLERPLDPYELGNHVETNIRRAELFLDLEETISAEDSLRKARVLYEEGRIDGWLEPSPRFGVLYSHLGDLRYDASSYERAQELFIRARDEGYDSEDMAYKMGYISYIDQDFTTALREFAEAAGQSPTANLTLAFAQANAYFYRGDYNLSTAYYQRVVDRLEDIRSGIPTFQLLEDSENRQLLEFLMRATTNLGASYYRLYETRRGRQDLALSQFYLSEATELYENYLRDPETGIRTEGKGLAFLNLRNLLIPGREDLVQVEGAIPRYMEELNFD